MTKTFINLIITLLTEDDKYVSLYIYLRKNNHTTQKRKHYSLFYNSHINTDLIAKIVNDLYMVK